MFAFAFLLPRLNSYDYREKWRKIWEKWQMEEVKFWKKMESTNIINNNSTRYENKTKTSHFSTTTTTSTRYSIKLRKVQTFSIHLPFVRYKMYFCWYTKQTAWKKCVWFFMHCKTQQKYVGILTERLATEQNIIIIIAHIWCNCNNIGELLFL